MRSIVGVRYTGLLRAALVGLLCVALSGCAAIPAKRADNNTQRAVIENYFAALNRRDVLPLTAYLTPDFEWISLLDGERVVEVNSREALAEMLRSYFDRNAHHRWQIEAVNGSGNVLAITERVEWQESGAMQSRRTVGVYELQDERIRRVTYFLSEH